MELSAQGIQCLDLFKFLESEWPVPGLSTGKHVLGYAFPMIAISITVVKISVNTNQAPVLEGIVYFKLAKN